MDNDSVPKQIHDCTLERERTMRRTLLALLAIMAVLMTVLMGVIVSANSSLVSQAESHAQEIERLTADNSMGGHPQSQLPLRGDLGEEPGRGEITLLEMLEENAPSIRSGQGPNGAQVSVDGGETVCAAFDSVENVEEMALKAHLGVYAIEPDGRVRVGQLGWCHTVHPPSEECTILYSDGGRLFGDVGRCED